MIRTIDGFHQDDEGDWVAELSCLHNQHVRHRPPFQERPWVTSEAGRADRVGSQLDCPLCDRMERPADLETVRTAGPFDADSLPGALRRAHLVAERTWGVLRVLEGSVVFAIEATPPVSVRVQAGDDQPIPPGVPHLLRVDESVRLAIDFLAKPNPPARWAQPGGRCLNRAAAPRRRPRQPDGTRDHCDAPRGRPREAANRRARSSHVNSHGLRIKTG